MKTTETLTEREREVLGLLADGLAHEEIAQRLGIGSETVRTHVRKASSLATRSRPGRPTGGRSPA